MSINCVDSALELAKEYNTAIILIASRHQIDSWQFNKGNVNNWPTFEFSRRAKIKGYLFNEKNLYQFIKKISPLTALLNVKESMRNSPQN